MATTAAKPTIIAQPTTPYVDSSISYAQEWKQFRQRKQQQFPQLTIYGLAFLDHQTLVACTSKGELCFFPLSHLDNNSTEADLHVYATVLEDQADESSSKSTVRDDCIFRFSVTDGCLYTLDVFTTNGNNETTTTTNNNNKWLRVGGDGGVWLFHGDDCHAWIQQQQQQASKSSSPPQPRQHYRLHPSAYHNLYSAAVRDTAVDDDSFLLGAASDAFGCYKWNLETGQLLATLTHRANQSFHHSSTTTATTVMNQPLQCLAVVPDASHRLLLGDGTLWDTHHDACVERLSLGPPTNTSKHTTTNPPNIFQITSMALSSSPWWTVAGSSQAGKQQTTTGFVCTWHGPTRSLVSCAANLPAVPQQMILSSDSTNDHNNDGMTGSLISVANEPCVSLWESAVSLATSRCDRIDCPTPCGYAVAQESSLLAVAGVGDRIGLFRDQTILVGTRRVPSLL